jgi:hypothetical protein
MMLAAGIQYCNGVMKLIQRSKHCSDCLVESASRYCEAMMVLGLEATAPREQVHRLQNQEW